MSEPDRPREAAPREALPWVTPEVPEAPHVNPDYAECWQSGWRAGYQAAAVLLDAERRATPLERKADGELVKAADAFIRHIRSCGSDDCALCDAALKHLGVAHDVWTKSETARTHGQHGRDCPKVQHHGEGYLHDAADDHPYRVDGVMYCGRCHGWLGMDVSRAEAAHTCDGGMNPSFPGPCGACERERFAQQFERDLAALADRDFGLQFAAEIADKTAETADVIDPSNQKSSVLRDFAIALREQVGTPAAPRPVPPPARTCGTWEPIASAPKDGTIILVYVPADGDDRAEIASVHWAPHADKWLCANSGWTLESPQPTHWMPLPAPPVAGLGEEREG